MALPVLNNTAPIYELTVPSTKNKLKYRPFLVKEQKNMLIAMESKDASQIMNSVADCIENCVEDVDFKKLSTFDVDYIFLQIRSKSAGEISKVNGICTECQAENVIEIDLSKINIENVKKGSQNIELTDNISVNMRYPTYMDVKNNHNIFSSDLNTTELIFEMINICMYSIMTENDNILVKDESKEEVDTFINSLTTKQFEKIMEFIQSLPTLTHIEKYTCSSCGKENQIEFNGLQDFF